MYRIHFAPRIKSCINIYEHLNIFGGNSVPMSPLVAPTPQTCTRSSSCISYDVHVYLKRAYRIIYNLHVVVSISCYVQHYVLRGDNASMVNIFCLLLDSNIKTLTLILRGKIQSFYLREYLILFVGDLFVISRS